MCSGQQVAHTLGLLPFRGLLGQVAQRREVSRALSAFLPCGGRPKRITESDADSLVPTVQNEASVSPGLPYSLRRRLTPRTQNGEGKGGGEGEGEGKGKGEGGGAGSLRGGRGGREREREGERGGGEGGGSEGEGQGQGKRGRREGRERRES